MSYIGLRISYRLKHIKNLKCTYWCRKSIENYDLKKIIVEEIFSTYDYLLGKCYSAVQDTKHYILCILQKILIN